MPLDDQTSKKKEKNVQKSSSDYRICYFVMFILEAEIFEMSNAMQIANN